MTNKIIFDLDDTLYKEGELRERREKAIWDLLGEKVKDYLEIRKTKGTISSLEELGITRKQFYKLMESVPINLEKDNRLIELLRDLKKKHKLIVLSNSPRVSVGETLRQLGVLELIDEYYGGDDFKSNKPAEENFFMVETGDICVGNHFEKDLLVPKKKGAISVLVGDSEKGEDSAKPDAFPDSQSPKKPQRLWDFHIESIYGLEQLNL